MRTNVLGFIAVAAFAGLAPPAQAADTGPALVYGTGGKFDKFFDEAGFAGAERFKRETGVAYREFEPQNPSQILQALRRFAKDGNQPIVVLSFEAEDSLRKVAQEFPRTASLSSTTPSTFPTSRRTSSGSRRAPTSSA